MTDVDATLDAINILYARLANEFTTGAVIRVPRPVEYAIIGGAIYHLRQSLHQYLTGGA